MIQVREEPVRAPRGGGRAPRTRLGASPARSEPAWTGRKQQRPRRRDALQPSAPDASRAQGQKNQGGWTDPPRARPPGRAVSPSTRRRKGETDAAGRGHARGHGRGHGRGHAREVQRVPCSPDSGHVPSASPARRSGSAHPAGPRAPSQGRLGRTQIHAPPGDPGKAPAPPAPGAARLSTRGQGPGCCHPRHLRQ